MANAVMCTKCSNWVHDRCVKIKRVTTTLAKDFVCKQCVKTIKKTGEEILFFDQVDFVKSFLLVGEQFVCQ